MEVMSRPHRHRQAIRIASPAGRRVGASLQKVDGRQQTRNVLFWEEHANWWLDSATAVPAGGAPYGDWSKHVDPRYWDSLADARVIFDGEASPSILCLVGDCGGGPYAGPYSGCTVKDERTGRFAGYRLFIKDTIRFRSHVNVLINHGESFNSGPISSYGGQAETGRLLRPEVDKDYDKVYDKVAKPLNTAHALARRLRNWGFARHHMPLLHPRWV